jgi:hypothetical protein
VVRSGAVDYAQSASIRDDPSHEAAGTLAELLGVPYCHLVFTLPHELNGLGAHFGRGDPQCR